MSSYIKVGTVGSAQITLSVQQVMFCTDVHQDEFQTSATQSMACLSHPTVEAALFGSNVSERLSSSREELQDLSLIHI